MSEKLETQVILAVELSFCLPDQTQPIQVQKMANALRRSLASRP